MSKYVIITEKPSQAQAIATALGIKAKHRMEYELKDGGLVVHARGHCLRLVSPEKYETQWAGTWSYQNLPILPSTWKYEPAKDVESELSVIKRALASTSHVIIATDAGREGELIARELLEYFKYSGKIERLWTSTLTTKSIKAAMAALRTNAEMIPLYESAVARQRCDLMYGYSLTRAVTLSMGIPRTTFRNGRVKTPVLGLIVKRELEIKNFVVEEYYELEAKVKVHSGQIITMKHAPEPDKRIKSKDQANALKKKAEGHIGPIQVESNKQTRAPDLPFSIDTLQQVADAKLGWSASTTLKIPQELYDQKIISYPRSDCPYLGESLIEEVPSILEGIATIGPAYSKYAKLTTTNLTLRKSVFDDAKLSDHHGIIPTGQTMVFTPQQSQLYAIIADRFLKALNKDYVYQQTNLTLNANSVIFKTTGIAPISPGWKDIKLFEDVVKS